MHAHAAAPLVVVLGGTDCTLPAHSPEKVPAALFALRRAVTIVAFNAEMRGILKGWAPDVVHKVVVIAPCFDLASSFADSVADAVPSASLPLSMPPLAGFSLRALLDRAAISPAHPFSSSAERVSGATAGADRRARLLLLIAGLRPIKDVAFLFDAVRRWHARDARVHLVVMGPPLDAEYAAHLFADMDAAAAKNRSGGGTEGGDVASVGVSGASLVAHGDDATLRGVRSDGRGCVYVPPVAAAHALAAMQEADAVVNSSVSEGMSNVLMESMSVGTVCVARANAGNRALIAHLENGVLFGTPEEFVDGVQRVLDDAALQHRLSVAALRTMRDLSAARSEADEYDRLVAQCAL